ncbi:auxin-responsive protein SAUR32-like [Gastrolobium bilobum]|uniref:auxin-responsive protein SAUR32-like n=1 Tax=Gastrolobium bilobum TaxID=150636 RepID=UPI002AB04BC5|nr:auxin-responsive protein SAUR32-like [Gastrolobium bilobum]
MMLGKSFRQVAVTYHHHHHHHGKEVITKDIPKGCMAIKVGQGEEQQRITVPVSYLNHPLFSQLLKEAEEEYGFAQQGTIIIPCQVQEFKHVQHMIDRDRSLQQQQQHHHHLVGCFRA